MNRLDDEAGRFIVARTTSGAARAATSEAAALLLIVTEDVDRPRGLLNVAENGGFSKVRQVVVATVGPEPGAGELERAGSAPQ